MLPSLVIVIALMLAGVTRVLLRIRASGNLVRASDAFPKDYQVGDATAIPMTYVATGASTAVGTGVQRVEETYPYLIASHFASRGYHVRVINLAQNGATFEQIVHDQMTLVANFRPLLVTVSAGTNDASRRTPIGTFQAQAHQLTRSLVASQALLLLVSNTPDLGNAPGIPWLLKPFARRRAELQNATLLAVLEQTAVQTVDVFGGLASYGSVKLKGWFAADGVHPSAMAYQQWSRLFIAQTERNDTP